MPGLDQTHLNNALAALSQKAAPSVLHAIKTASQTTGVDFGYLLEQAHAESGFKSDVKAKTSSASGLYQFIEKTWLGMVKKHGAKYGLAELADKISSSGDVNDQNTRQKILDLRNDPEKSALLAAEYAADNKAQLEKKLDHDRHIGSVELYLAHFMGASGAAEFLNAMDKHPFVKGASLLGKAAAANKNVFFDKDTGIARNLQEIYDFFSQKFTSGPAQTENYKTETFEMTRSRRHTNTIDSLNYILDMHNDVANDFFVEDLMPFTEDEKKRSPIRVTMPVSSRSLLQSPVELMILAQIEDK